jgi:hypothetical protein
MSNPQIIEGALAGKARASLADLIQDTFGLCEGHVGEVQERASGRLVIVTQKIGTRHGFM